ncbi:MAG: signal peptide peptidase SppA [Syntrophobacterales bacterium]|nr:MAG: signal peptide peptidase SppA [Syntrophobacterales bacterium]
MIQFRLIFAFLLLPVLSGCTLFNINLISPVKPLEEKVVEGEGRSKLLLLDIAGFISEKEPDGVHLTKQQPSIVSRVKESLRKAEKDEDIAGVILRINSPGGTVTASDIIYHEIKGFENRKKVPVYACITGLGTSGAYYIATASDLITAHPTAVTGSIGVILLNFNLEGFLGKIGVTENSIKSGAKKDLMSTFRASTEEERRIMQEIIDSFARRFLDVIMARKNNQLERQELEKLADGRVYTAEQAFAAKLIDRTEYLDDTINGMKKALGIKEAKVVSYYRPGDYRGSIYSTPPGAASGVNLININADGLEMISSPQFLYLWRQ